MANVLINNKDTFINPQFVMSIAYNDEEKIYELNMTDYSKFVLESVSYNLLKVKKENPIAPFDMKEYERMGGTKELLKKNKYVQPSIVPGGGLPGKSAYQIWLDNGGDGNETDFLRSLEGATGDSAYQVAVKQGFEGSEDEWLASLVGPEGPKGESGSGLDIKKVYATVDEMNEGYATDGLPEGSMVIVTTVDPSEEDNGKIYLKGPEQYDFLVDIAVVTEAVQGPKGEDGATFIPDVSPEGLISWTNNKGLDNPESVSIVGPQGKNGFNGLPGVNGLSIKLTKSDSHIQATYVGKRILQGHYSPERLSPTLFNSYQFTTLNGFVLENIPKEATKVRLSTISFLAFNDNGEMVGSSNPAYRPGLVSPGSSPHLGTLDPSNGTTYPVKSGRCVIDCEVDTKAACVKEMADINKAIASSGKTATKIESMIYEFTYLDAEEAEIGKTNIRERFLTDITDTPQNLVALEDLKGQDGAAGEKGADGAPGAVTTITAVEATVDSGYEAEPSVEARMEDVGENQKKIILSFHNLKGTPGLLGSPGPKGKDAKITAVTAEVDSNSGSPEVEVTPGGDESNRTFHFAFRNLKGQDGAQGVAGTPGTNGKDAKITNVTASVDANNGVPSVEVQMGGTENERTLNFVFKNLKGADGAQGETGATGEPGPAGAPGKDAKSLLELFRENGYSENDEAALVKKLIALIQPS